MFEKYLKGKEIIPKDVVIRNKIKEGRKEKETNSDVKKIIDYYHNKYIEKFGMKPHINGGSAGKNLKILLKRFSVEEMKKMIDLYLDTDKKFFRDTGYSLNVLVSANTVNGLQLQLKKETAKKVILKDEEIQKRIEKLKGVI